MALMLSSQQMEQLTAAQKLLSELLSGLENSETIERSGCSECSGTCKDECTGCHTCKDTSKVG